MVYIAPLEEVQYEFIFERMNEWIVNFRMHGDIRCGLIRWWVGD